MNKTIKFHVNRQPRIDGYEIWATWITERGERAFLNNVTVETKTEAEMEADGSFAMHRYAPIELSTEAAQSLMDELWNAGIKPSGGEGHTAHIRAINKHLNDMRKLVFHKEGIE